MLLLLSSCKKRYAKKGVTGLLYEKKLVLESSLNRLQILVLSMYFFNQNYVHAVIDFASEPGDFPGLYKHKVIRCLAEHFLFPLAFSCAHCF